MIMPDISENKCHEHSVKTVQKQTGRAAGRRRALARGHTTQQISDNTHLRLRLLHVKPLLKHDRDFSSYWPIKKMNSNDLIWVFPYQIIRACFLACRHFNNIDPDICMLDAKVPVRDQRNGATRLRPTGRRKRYSSHDGRPHLRALTIIVACVITIQRGCILK